MGKSDTIQLLINSNHEGIRAVWRANSIRSVFTLRTVGVGLVGDSLATRGYAGSVVILTLLSERQPSVRLSVTRCSV